MPQNQHINVLTLGSQSILIKHNISTMYAEYCLYKCEEM